MPRRTIPQRPGNSRRGIFSKMVFVLSGDFEKSHQKMEAWIGGQGGRVDKVVTSETTHLICTMDDFKNKVTHVKDAWKVGKAKCKIVDVKFITDCFVTTKPKLVLEKTYLLAKILAEERKKRTTSVRPESKGLPKPGGLEETIEPPRHHTYVDGTGFQYKIVLYRTTSISNGEKLEEKLTIYLFESDPMPLTYRLARKYKRAGLAAVLYHDKDVGKGFQKAYAEFRSIFEEKTGINWDQRLEKLKQEEGNYVYMPPTGGKPVGTLPFRSYGRKKSDQKLEQKSNIVAPLSKGAGSGDSQMMDPDLMDDTDSGDDAS